MLLFMHCPNKRGKRHSKQHATYKITSYLTSILAEAPVIVYEYLYMLRGLAEDGNQQAKGLLKELEEKIVSGFKEYTRDSGYLEDSRYPVGKDIAKSGDVSG